MNPFLLPDSPRGGSLTTAHVGHRILYSQDEITNIRLSWINSCIHVLHNKNLHGYIKIFSTYKLLLQNLRTYENADLYELARSDVLSIIEKIENRIDEIIWPRENIFEKIIQLFVPIQIARFFDCIEDDFRDGDTFPDNLDDHIEKISIMAEKIVVDLLYYFNMEKNKY